MKFAITLTALMATALSAAAVEFKVKWQPGKRYAMEQKANSATTLALGETKISSATRMTRTMHHDVSAEEEGVKVLHQMTGIKMTTSMNGAVALEYDSSDPAKSGGLIGPMLNPIANASFSSIYNKEGALVETRGLDKIPDANQMGLGKRELELMVSETLLLLPKKDVEVGDTWSQEITIPLGGMGKDAVVTYDLKFEGVEEVEGKRIAKITMKGAKEEDAEGEEGGEEVLTVKMKEASGTILFDLDLGQVVESASSVKLEMGVPAGVPVGEDGPATMPVSVTSAQKLLEVTDVEK